MTWQRSDPHAGFLFHYYSRAVPYGKGRVYTTMRVGFSLLEWTAKDRAMRCEGFPDRF